MEWNDWHETEFQQIDSSIPHMENLNCSFFYIGGILLAHDNETQRIGLFTRYQDSAGEEQVVGIGMFFHEFPHRLLKFGNILGYEYWKRPWKLVAEMDRQRGRLLEIYIWAESRGISNDIPVRMRLEGIPCV